MSDIVIAESMSEAAVADLATDFDVVYDPELHARADDLAAALADCAALVVRNRTRVTAALLDDGPELRAIGRLGVGLDNIDMDACKARGIRVFPATGANVVAVAEYVVAAALAMLRGAFHASEEVLAGAWPRDRLVGREIAGKTVGIVGFGAIGQAVAARAGALGMHALAHDPHLAADDAAWSGADARRCETLPELLGASDVVTLHVPLVPTTKGMIDAEALAAMRPRACLINTARGGVVDEPALAAALREGRLGSAVLDVYADEPLPAGSNLDGVPNLLLTPHVAGLTEEANERVGALVAARIREALA